MWCVGLAAHAPRSTMCVLDENGIKIFDQEIKDTMEPLAKTISASPNNGGALGPAPRFRPL
jgi:hypothetical protein